LEPGAVEVGSRSMNNIALSRSTPKTALVTVPVILGIGFMMGQLSNSGYGNDWFGALTKPAAMPPGWAFGTAWSILYVLLGVALAMIWNAPPSRQRSTGLILFFVQLTLNFAWSPIFFGAHRVALALAVIIAMLLLSAAATVAFVRIKLLAAWLMAPYLAWLGFAAYLNYGILRLNPAG